jgi:hypothetical protein
LGFTITCVPVGYERRGNRQYWFVQVTVENHTDIENKFRQLAESALANSAIQTAIPGFNHVLAYNAPRYLPNGREVVFDSVNFGKYFRARLWGEHGRSAGTVNTKTWVDDWLSGAGVAEFACRVSQPLNLNTFTPCFATSRQRRKLETTYTLDARGIANDLVAYNAINWPFLTLSTRSDVQPAAHARLEAEVPREVPMARLPAEARTADGCRDGE